MQKYYADWQAELKAYQEKIKDCKERKNEHEAECPIGNRSCLECNKKSTQLGQAIGDYKVFVRKFSAKYPQGLNSR